MLGDILGGALVGGVAGGTVAGVFVLIMKLLGKPLGKRETQPRELPQTVPVPATWRTESKRVLFGLVWLLVIWFLTRLVIGMTVGSIAGSQVDRQSMSSAEYKQAAFVAGQDASLTFLQNYGTWIFLGSLAASVVGTATGFLPGTRRPRIAVAPVTPPSASQWPPPPTGAV